MRTDPKTLLLLTPVLAVALPASLPAQDPGSTYGHARTRTLAELGRLPTPTDVHVSDIVDYHRHRLPLPRAGDDIGLDVRIDSTTAGRDTLVLQIGYTSQPADDRSDVPPVHLALVLDRSGSMAAAGKLDRLQQALASFAQRLRPEDRITLVTYSDDARVEAESRRVGDRRWLLEAIERLQPGGATNLHAGMMAGLRALARDEAGPVTRRAILLTDGIANRGETDPERILADARTFTDGGVDLSTIGLGTDLNGELLDRLARGAHGLFHFVADAADIDKVFVRESDTLLCPAARRPRLCVQLPPGLALEHVFGYRPERTGGGFEVALPDLNRGVTAVVLATLRLDRHLQEPAPMRIAARIEYRDPADGTPRSVSRSENLPVDPHGARRLSDPELRKNYTIAVLAQGMHDMAVAAEAARWSEADAALRRGLEFAQRQFPGDGDQDLQRVRQMAEDQRRVLARYLDRFRDY